MHLVMVFPSLVQTGMLLSCVAHSNIWSEEQAQKGFLAASSLHTPPVFRGQGNRLSARIASHGSESKAAEKIKQTLG